MYALDCQYKYNQSFDLSNKIYFPDSSLNERINVSNFVVFQTNGLSIKIINKIEQKIELDIKYTMTSSWFGNQARSYTISIDPYGYYSIEDESTYSCRGYPCSIQGLSFLFKQPSNVTLELCSLCNLDICKNDGISCTNPQDCGSNSCVEGYCSNSALCYNNNCKCSADKIQCNDNKRCVTKGIVPLDVKPECNKSQECATGYIDPNSNLCTKSPSQLEAQKEQKLKDEMLLKIQEENAKKEQEAIKNKRTIAILLGLVIIVLIVIVGKIIIEKVRSGILQMEIERIQEEIKHMEKEIELMSATKEYSKNLKNSINEEIKEGIKKIEKLNQQIKDAENKAKISYIHQLKKEEEKQKERSKKLINTELELKQRIQKIERLREIEEERIVHLLGTYKKKYGKEFILDNGYIRFANNLFYPSQKGQLFHRWLFEKEHKRKIKINYEIHHKDFDKLNNNIENLEELTPEEHKAKHINKFNPKNL